MHVPKVGGLSGRLADRVCAPAPDSGQRGWRGDERAGRRQRRDRRRQCDGVRPGHARAADARVHPDRQRVRLGADGGRAGPGLGLQRPDAGSGAARPRRAIRSGSPWSTSYRCRPPSTGTGSMSPTRWTGWPGSTRPRSSPGRAFTYEFTATPAGTRWYHSHTDPAVQVPLGLYGALIVEPASPTATYDREYTLHAGRVGYRADPRRGGGDRAARAEATPCCGAASWAPISF